jgi:hypothetical protein
VKGVLWEFGTYIGHRWKTEHPCRNLGGGRRFKSGIRPETFSAAKAGLWDGTRLIVARQRLASEADNLEVGMANIWEP